MGFGTAATDCRDILQQYFGFCKLPHDPDWPVDTIVDDFPLGIRSVFNCMSDWEESPTRLRNRFCNHAPSVKRYIVLFEEPYVPDSKKPTQEKRRKVVWGEGGEPQNSKNLTVDQWKKTTVLFADEIEKENFKGPVPETHNYLQRLFSTHAIQPALNKFVCETVIGFEFANHSQYELVIDGGYEQPFQGKRDRKFDNGIFIGKQNLFRRKTPGVYEEIMDNKHEWTASASKKIGESDLKIAWHISDGRGVNYLVRSLDFDVVLILLLHLRKWISDDGHIKYGILIDQGKHKIDVVALWRNILWYFHAMYPLVTCPVEVVAFLFLFNKTDYTSGFPFISTKLVWNVFFESGHKQLFTEHDIVNNGITVKGVSRIGIEIKEEKWFNFLYLCYKKKIDTKNEIPLRKTGERYDFHPLRELHKRKRSEAAAKKKSGEAKTNAKKKDLWQIPTDHELVANLRRMFWCIDYMCNGDQYCKFQDQYYLDVTETREGLSLHGWEKSSIGCGIREAKIVYGWNDKPFEIPPPKPEPTENHEKPMIFSLPRGGNDYSKKNRISAPSPKPSAYEYGEKIELPSSKSYSGSYANYSDVSKRTVSKKRNSDFQGKPPYKKQRKD